MTSQKIWKKGQSNVVLIHRPMSKVRPTVISSDPILTWQTMFGMLFVRLMCFQRAVSPAGGQLNKQHDAPISQHELARETERLDR